MFRRPQLLTTISLTYSWAFGMFMVSIPLIAKEHLRVSETMLGLYGCVPAVLYIGSAWVSGRLSERLGRKGILAFAALFSAVSSCLLILMQRPWLLLPPAALGGVAAGFFWPVLEAAMSDGQTSRQIKRATGIFNMSWMIGLVVGPVTGGFLYQIHRSLPLAASGGMYAGILLLVCLPRAMEIAPWGKAFAPWGEAFAPWGEASAPWRTSRGPERHEAASARKRALFVHLGLIANMTTYFMLGSYRALLPEYTDQVGITGKRYGFLAGVIYLGMLLSNLLLMRWRRWHYSLRFLFGAQALAAALLVSFALCNDFHALLLLALLIGFPAGVTYYSSIYYGLEQSASKGAHGGNHEAVIGLGLALGPWLGSLTIAATDRARSNLILCAGVYLLAIAAQAALTRKRLRE
jgi:MFS family permease